MTLKDFLKLERVMCFVSWSENKNIEIVNIKALPLNPCAYDKKVLTEFT